MNTLALHLKYITLGICLSVLLFPIRTQAQSTQAVSLVSQAQSAFYKQQYSQTIALCRRAIKISPRYARAYSWMGTAYGREYIVLSRVSSRKKEAEQKKQAAIAAFRKVLLLAPDSLDAKRAKDGLAKLMDESPPARPIAQADPVWTVAETRTVSPLGPYTSINAALENAPANTRIVVKPGNYLESIILTKPVQIIGEGNSDEIVVESQDRPALQMSTSKALVKGVSFRGDAVNNAEFHVVDIGMGRLIMDDCKIQGNSRSTVGIYNAGTNPTLRNCKISGSKISAVVIYAVAGGLLDQCEISGASFANVEIRQRANPLLKKCVLRDGYSKGLVAGNDGYGYLIDCTITNNSFAGVEEKRGGQAYLQDCTITNNGVGLWMRTGSKITLNQCDLTGNRNGAIHIEKDAHLQGGGNKTE